MQYSVWITNKNDARYYNIPKEHKGPLVNKLLEEHWAREDAGMDEADSASEVEKWKMINGTKTIDELIAVLQELGDIAISANRGSYNMSKRVRLVHQDRQPVNMLTRNYGIRQQYIYLAAAESGA